MINRFLSIFFAIIFYTADFAQIGGQFTYQFLEINTSAYAAALGGKLIANPTDLTLVYYNPALLDSIKGNQLTVSYQNRLAGINLGEFVYSFRTKSRSNLAVGVHYINYGKFEGYDVNGQATGTFSASETTPYIIYSFPVDTVLTLGASFKPVFSSFDVYKSYGFALDLGAIFKLSEYSYFAVALRNIGRQLKPYQSIREPLPYNLAAGFTGKFKYSPFRFNFTFDYLNYWNLRFVSSINQINIVATSVDTTSIVARTGQLLDELFRHMHFGTEFFLGPKFTLLFGYNYRLAKEMALPTTNTFSGLSAGLRFESQSLNLTYSFQKFLNFTVNTFGLTFNLDYLTTHRIFRQKK